VEPEARLPGDVRTSHGQQLSIPKAFSDVFRLGFGNAE
jgi:hypothetical protein